MALKIVDFIWLKHIVDKLLQKHAVTQQEVIEVFDNQPWIRFAEKGNFPDENAYAALGRSDAGRYLIVFFVYKKDRRALIVSARDMDEKERQQYGRR
jgi:uncharacterized DUF497 family protein